MTIGEVVEQLVRDGAFTKLVGNPLAQFGTPVRRYVGAELLPEKMVWENVFKEDGLRYRSEIANDATPYNPVQLKTSVERGSMTVELGYSDIGSQFTAQDYDALMRLLTNASNMESRPTMEAISKLVDWFNATIVRPLVEVNEKHRWDAIVNAQITRTGSNKMTETVSYENPTDHRFAPTVVWSNDANDPYVDIIAAKNVLADKGYRVKAIYTTNTVSGIMAGNTKIQQRVGRTALISGSVVTGLPGEANRSMINALFQQDELPAITEYNLRYTKSSGTTARFLEEDCMVFIGETDREVVIDRGEDEPLMFQGVLGYQAMGVCSGYSEPGRQTIVEAYNRKPPRIDAEGWQVSLPVITDPEAIVVIDGIA